jgi:uncharacterized protein
VATRALAAVGRTAFSNYILQTVLATSIFYGHGLGLFGQVSRIEALGVVVVIWMVQIPLSVLVVAVFPIRPVRVALARPHLSDAPAAADHPDR